MLASPGLNIAVEKALSRANSFGADLQQLALDVRGARPVDLASDLEKDQRRRFLETMYGENRLGDLAYERIINGNELQDASFLPRGELVTRTVMRIVLRTPDGAVRGFGTGFLVGEGLLLTNNHVLPNSDVAASALAEAFYERDVYGREVSPLRFAFDPSLFYTSRELDFTLVGVAPLDLGGVNALGALGWLPLIGGAGKAAEGEWLTIIQHPMGERKQLCVRENQLIKRDVDVLWYSTDTLAGSSGSPVFNNDWLLVALHHSGVPKTLNGKWQTTDGRDYDPATDREDRIQWIANEGIRISRIVETLRTDARIRDNARIRAIVSTDITDLSERLPVLYAAGQAPPVSPGRAMPAALPANPLPHTPSTPIPNHDQEKAMPDRVVTLTLAIDESGQARILDQKPLVEALDVAEAAGKKGPVIDAPVDEERDWGSGYDPKFLDRSKDKSNDTLWVPLPTLSPVNKTDVAPLLTKKSYYGLPIPNAADAAEGVLHYANYSVVMKQSRRLAYFSAANINGGVNFDISRGTDKWLWDDRIDRKHQLGNSFYVGNKFDRGHLVRREDMEWGTDPVDATQRANGTCTWTNCSPQHEDFNQDKKFAGKTAALWGGLEKYILEQTARYHKFRVQIFNGPIFGDDDPTYRGVKIPLKYWKVVVAVDASDKLYATGYILSQDFLVDRDWAVLDEAAIAKPFGKFETYQVPLSEIEAATGLSFHYGDGAGLAKLSAVDPLAIELKKKVWQRRKRSSAANASESFGGSARSLTDPLSGHGDILLNDERA